VPRLPASIVFLEQVVRISLSLVIGLLVSTAPVAALAGDCAAGQAPALQSAEWVAPAPGLDSVAGNGVAGLGLAEPAAELSAAAVLQRIRERDCLQVASPAEGYQKRTEFDNTPYRYNMQPGKVNAAEFAAWMASRGIRIVGADEAGVQPAATAVASVPAAVEEAGDGSAAETATAPIVAQ
jgi:hypothetical protein